MRNRVVLLLDLLAPSRLAPLAAAPKQTVLGVLEPGAVGSLQRLGPIHDRLQWPKKGQDPGSGGLAREREKREEARFIDLPIRL